ncbi:ATP-binding cassette domain-containing protein [Roseomonas fluvialis]|uniref:Transporter HasD n=1 Tax=Roseomonas fluvialis TaxID=1750527 RepID=A0ABM9SED8_9PROT|nr:ATP-binding cassette domain-containing protein [Roseomonas fluvialis]BDG71944.1 transporter HasD [Roseomonas fluvialis]
MNATLTPALLPPRLLAPTLAVCVVLSVAVQATMLTAPMLTMHVFDGVLESRNLGTLWVLSAAFLAALLLGGVLQYLRAALLAALAERIGRRLQLRALAASVRVALGGDRTAAGRALQDVAELRRMLGGSIPADVLDLLSIPLALGFLWLLHPLFFLVALMAALVQGAIGVLADRVTRGATAQAKLHEARGRRGLVQQLGLREMVLGLGMLPAALARFAPRHALALQRRGGAERDARALAGLLELAVFAQQGAIVGAGVWLLLAHEVSHGSMLAAATLVAFATRPVVHLVGHWRDWSEGLAAARRLAKLVRAGAPPERASCATDAPSGLMVQGLSLFAPGRTRPLVDALDLALPPGSALVLAGPNGAGKSTLIRALLGLAAPASGRVLLDGQDTWRTPRDAFAGRIGYLPQEAQLLDGSILENIARFDDDGASAAVASARRVGAHDAIGRLPRGYENAAGADAGLSGGQARLVALARAFHGAPRVIVLDEPEAGLDGAARAGVRAGVAAARAEGSVVLLVSHDVAAWRGAVDGVLRLTGEGPWTLETTA